MFLQGKTKVLAGVETERNDDGKLKAACILDVKVSMNAGFWVPKCQNVVIYQLRLMTCADKVVRYFEIG